jgi:hypothetical protein
MDKVSNLMHRPFVRACGRRFTLVVLPAFAGFLIAVLTANAESAPLYAKLLGRLDSQHLADGSPFFVKTAAPWTDDRCTLKAGTTLEGEIVHVVHRGSGVKHEEMGVLFHPFPCSSDETQQLVPLLVAMEAPRTSQQDDNPLAKADLADSFASMVASHSPTGMSGGGGTSQGGATSRNPHVSAAAANKELNGLIKNGESPLRMAEVRGFSKLTLTLPRLLTDPTLLSSSHSLLIDRDTRVALVLRPIAGSEDRMASASSPVAPAAAPTSTETASTAPAPKPVPTVEEKEQPEIDLCVETGCAIASTIATTGTKLDRTLSLRTLGYRVRTNQVLRSLTDDAAVAFLGADQVLVTFNAHPLVRRSRVEADRAIAPRMIRALVISATTGKLLQQQEWRVPQRGPYLWPLGEGHVLAHIGDTLTIYGPNLAVEHQWTPHGIIRLVRISPSRALVVAAIERERHTPEQHRRLADFLGPDRTVEEDEDLTILDGSLNVLGTEPIDGDLALPAILDSGLLLSDAGARERWMIQQLTWAHRKQSIARVNSSCPLRVETLPTNLILLAGCGAGGGSYWYKVVRADGKTLLTGTMPTDSWVETADAPPSGKVFAIGIAEASRPVDFDTGMVTSDFQSVTVSVYRSQDGRRVYATRSSHGAVNRHSFALNVTGDRLAILSGDALSLYRVRNQP